MRLAILFLFGCWLTGATAWSAEVEARLGLDGRVTLRAGGQTLGQLEPLLATPQWQFGSAVAATMRQEGESRQFRLRVGDAARAAGEARLSADGDSAAARWTYKAETALDLATLGVSLNVDAARLMGGSVRVDETSVAIPEAHGQTHLHTAAARRVVVTFAGGREVEFRFEQPVQVLVQDNRQWTQTFSVRFGPQGVQLPQGQTLEVAVTMATVGGMLASRDGMTVITAGDEWLPMRAELDIEPGSALDFSGMGFTDAPAGKHGHLTVSPTGGFAFENLPGVRQRFYGINLCFGAHYLSRAETDRLTDRLVRLGYNTLRIHHHESGLTEGRPGLDWNPERLDQLDYLIAACKARGIYVTTDLYVSRPVNASQVGMPGEDNWAYKVKVLIPVHEPAFEDWKAFSCKLLNHVNPHTGVRWADEPTIAWLAMINEGNIGNYWNDVKSIPQWTQRWNQWLTRRYGDRANLAANWGPQLSDGEDPVAGSVALPAGIYGNTPRHRDCTVFVAEVEAEMYDRMARFLRDEIGTRALLTNMNGWTNHIPNQIPRQRFDYVDDHFYVDHPVFLERDWSLPSRCDNENPVLKGAPGGRGQNLVRLWDRPFTVSEYNYSGPGRFRGVGGILTGALGALQQWDVIWRFAYSHSREAMFEPRPMGYFDLVSDPLNQAADRAAIALYLRSDLEPARGRVTVRFSPDDLTHPKPLRVPTLSEGPAWLSWVTGLGTAVGDTRPVTPGERELPTGWHGQVVDGLAAFGTDGARLVAALKQDGILPAGNRTDPDRQVYESDHGQMLLDGSSGVLRFDTPRTAGGYAEPGQTIESPGAGVSVGELSVGATVFVTSLDGSPIRSSRRLLVTHLTDLQNTGITYAEQERKTLLAWGTLPHLVRAGTAMVRLDVAAAGGDGGRTASARVGGALARCRCGWRTGGWC